MVNPSATRLSAMPKRIPAARELKRMSIVRCCLRI
jgi:hypothetical protein